MTAPRRAFCARRRRSGAAVFMEVEASPGVRRLPAITAFEQGGNPLLGIILVRAAGEKPDAVLAFQDPSQLGGVRRHRRRHLDVAGGVVREPAAAADAGKNELS